MMLSIQPPISSSPKSQTSLPKFTPNVLPCRINHTGPVNASRRYWNIEQDDKDRKVAYFRGRKLFGREVKLDDNYKGAWPFLVRTIEQARLWRSILTRSGNIGIVVRETDRTLPHSTPTNNSKPSALDTNPQEDEEAVEEEDEDEPEPIKVLEEVATFDEIVVWGHEQVPGEDDAFVRGVQEWTAFAEAMHSVGGEVDTSKA
ncbi:hypothetical protein MMC13_006365 [Lambiella insularis]|nr:hypothetical protein [Lambiella insularis]